MLLHPLCATASGAAATTCPSCCRSHTPPPSQSSTLPPIPHLPSPPLPPPQFCERAPIAPCASHILKVAIQTALAGPPPPTPDTDSTTPIPPPSVNGGALPHKAKKSSKSQRDKDSSLQPSQTEEARAAAASAALAALRSVVRLCAAAAPQAVAEEITRIVADVSQLPGPGTQFDTLVELLEGTAHAIVTRSKGSPGCLWTLLHSDSGARVLPCMQPPHHHS